MSVVKDSGNHPDSGFLSRWSRRKRGDHDDAASVSNKPAPAETVRDVEHCEPDELADHSAIAIPDSQSPVETNPAQPLLTDADMPDIETLTDDSDFGQFMNAGVSDTLRKRALAKLFHLPVFGIRDGLDDYDDDFRSFQALGDMVTTDMKFEQRRLAERAKEAAEREAELAAQEASEDAGQLAQHDEEIEDLDAGEEADVDDDSDIGDAEDETV